VLTFALASCDAVKEGVKQGIEDASKGSIQQGVWDEAGTEFTNDWSNIKLTLPEGYTRSSDEEIKAMMQMGQDVVTGGDSNLAYDLAACVRFTILSFNPPTEPEFLI
jgi:hypothetical protein